MVEEKRSWCFFPKQYGFFPYVFLLYLIFPIVFIAYENGMKMLFGYFLLLLFLITYRQLYFSAGKTFTVWLLLQMAIVCYLSMCYHPYHLFMGFFPAHFIVWYKSKKQFYVGLLLLMIATLAPLIRTVFLSGLRSILFIIPFLAIMFASPFGLRSMYHRMELEQKLDKANEQIKELIKRDERMRIARDLHDTLGHTFSLLTLKSQLVGKLIEKNGERARAEAREMEQISRTALKQVRELVSDLRSISVAEEVMEAKAILQMSHIQFHIEGDTALRDVEPIIQNILSMCLREAVTNIVKHSQAKNCFLTLDKTFDEINVVIQDDGVGLVNNRVHGSGLKGIEERLTLIGGSLSLSSNNGTTLAMKIPVVVKPTREDVVS